ncbi:MAG: VWA domain-containing protein [Nanoarchaeota archaeon]|nr:VWA domain-containing protein [Nanoarchaeota archaeon]
MISLLTSKICVKGYCLANPHYIYIIVPLFLLLLIIVNITFVKFKKKEEKQAFVKSHRLDRIIFIILRTILIFLLLIAIATPYKIKETPTQGNPSLTILSDNSSSFEIFDTTLAPKLKTQLEKYFPVTLKYIAYDTKSAIGDGILQNAEGDDNILVISDGNNNYGRDLGDIVLFSSILNTTINTIKISPIKKDVSVIIDGPSQVIEQSENSFRVIINNVGNVEYNRVEVFVDGAPVVIDSNGRFTWRFSQGYHKINARILFPKDDYFPQNNEYYKSVKSLLRPKVLFIGKDSPLQDSLRKVYDITVADSIKSSLDEYDAVILNDLNINKISDEKVDLLADYLSEQGNGLIVVGGVNSFNNGNYKKSYFESILPAQVGVAKKEKGGITNVVLVIDISESTGFGFSGGSSDSKIDVEKALAINILNDIDLDDHVGVVAFNHLGHVVWQLYELSKSLDKLPQKIASLKDGGGTLVFSGLFKAIGLLDRAQGSKNIIVISDGITVQPKDALNLAKDAASRGIRTYTVGVGENTNEQFMRDLALAGGGMYFKPSESQRLKLLFGESGGDIGDDSMNLVVVDQNHWITKGDLDLKAKLSGYNFVVPSSGGRKIVATDADRSIIVTGRYGLGRIVVLATDDGSAWAGQLFTKENSKIITRMVNWAIGDFTKDAEFDVRLRDTNVGSSIDVNVISNERPEEKGFKFFKIDSGLYSAKFRPKKEGFYQILGATVAVNYPDEYQKIGLNPKLEELVTISGGYVFNPNDIEKIKDAIISMSKRTKIDTINYRFPFVIAALLLFLIEVLIRRIKENRGTTGF